MERERPGRFQRPGVCPPGRPDAAGDGVAADLSTGFAGFSTGVSGDFSAAFSAAVEDFSDGDFSNGDFAGVALAAPAALAAPDASPGSGATACDGNRSGGSADAEGDSTGLSLCCKTAPPEAEPLPVPAAEDPAVAPSAALAAASDKLNPEPETPTPDPAGGLYKPEADGAV